MTNRLISARERTLLLPFAPALLLAVILIALPAAAASITNGDFEAVQIGPPYFSTNPADVPGWTHNGEVGDALLWAVGYSDPFGSIVTAGSGNQFVTLGGGFEETGAGSWSTSITGLIPGDSYLLSFMMANENTLSANQQIVVDFLSGSSTLPVTFTASQTPTANYWRNWEAEQETFLATDSAAIVRFSANTQFDVGLDDVTVSSAVVPEPSSAWLAAAALAVLFVHKRRGLRLRSGQS